MMTSMIRYIIPLILLIGICNCTSSLSIMVKSSQDECFYIPKKTGETITASFQV